MNNFNIKFNSDFEVSDEVRNRIQEMIDSVISKLSDKVSYIFAFAVKNQEDVGTEYVCVQRYCANLYNTKIASIISLFGYEIESKVSSPEHFNTPMEVMGKVTSELGKLVSYCKSNRVPIFYNIVTGNGYYAYYRKDDDGKRYTFDKADVEYIAKIVSPRDLGLFLENDLISKSLRYVITDYISAESLLDKMVDIYYPGSTDDSK